MTFRQFTFINYSESVRKMILIKVGQCGMGYGVVYVQKSANMDLVS